MKRLLILLAITLCFSQWSCTGLKTGGPKTPAKLYESFFVGEQGTQYFIKPLEFEEADGEKFVIDFTFRYKNEIKDSSNVNFSFLGDKLIKEVDKVTLNNGNVTVELENIDLLFNEKIKSDFVNRYSSTLSLQQVHDVFDLSDWKIIVEKEETTYTYIPSKRSKKSIIALKELLFDLQ